MDAFTVLALPPDTATLPVRIGVMARDRAAALDCARELFPEHTITAALLEVDW
jgi:hypothetical protein